MEDDRGHHQSFLVIECREYEILRHTPKGFWLNMGYGFSTRVGRFQSLDQQKKFVLNTATKRFACLTKAEAKESFLRRKQRQKSILQNRLDAVKQAIIQAEEIVT